MDVLRLADFAGGLNEVSESCFMQDNETPNCVNTVHKNGSISKRKGYRKIIQDSLSNSHAINGIYLYTLTDGTRQIIVVAQNSVWVIDEATLVKTELKSDLLGANVPISFITWSGVCYMSNGIDPVLSYNGAILAIEDKIPKGKFIAEKDNVIFVAGDHQHPSRVYYSEVGDPGKWVDMDGNPYHFEVPGEDVITGLIKLRGDLVIFKSNSIHMLYGSSRDYFQRREIQSGIGCVASGSITAVYDAIFFLSHDGVYAFDGASVRSMSKKVKDKVDSINNSAQAVATFFDNMYMLSYAEGSNIGNNAVLVYDLDTASWTYFTNINAGCFNRAPAKDGVYFGDSCAGYIYIFMPMGENLFSDDGQPIDFLYQTKVFNFSSPEVVKTFRHLLVELYIEGQLTLSYEIDGGIREGTLKFDGEGENPEIYWGADWGQMVWSKGMIKKMGRSFANGMCGSSIAFKITSRDYNPIKFVGLTLEFRGKRQTFRR